MEEITPCRIGYLTSVILPQMPYLDFLKMKRELARHWLKTN